MSAATVSSDVAIIGSGVAGALIAHRLVQQGLSVTVLEAGPRFTRAEALARQHATWKQNNSAPYPNTALAPRVDPDDPADAYILNDGPFTYRPHFLRGIGDTTWHWQAVALRFTPGDYTLKGQKAAHETILGIARRLGGEAFIHSELYAGYHTSGTLVMGADRKTSVTDPFGRSHDHRNLFVAGAAVFPSSGTANSTLTIAALALRTARAIGKDFG